MKEKRVINLCLSRSRSMEKLITQNSHSSKKNFSPLNIPLKRRLQTFTVLFVILLNIMVKKNFLNCLKEI